MTSSRAITRSFVDFADNLSHVASSGIQHLGQELAADQHGKRHDDQQLEDSHPNVPDRR